MAYADVQDLESRWRELDALEKNKASVLLNDAADMLSTFVEVDRSDEKQMSVLKIVSCNMVRRAMCSSDVEGIASLSQAVGSTSVTAQWSNTDGALFLTKNDKQMLGITDGAIRSVQAYTIFDEMGERNGAE